MSILSRLFPAPKERVIIKKIIPNNRAPSPLAAQPIPGVQIYEAIKEDGKRIPLNTRAAINPRVLVSGAQRETLSAYARYLYENYAVVSEAVDMLTRYSLPIYPQAKAGSERINTAYEEYFADWATRCDITGRFEFDELGKLIDSAMSLDGDALAVMVRDEESGEPRLQIIDAIRVTGRNYSGDQTMVDGVFLSPEGRVNGYRVEVENGYVTISPDECHLVFEPPFLGSYRGLSALRRGMNDARDTREILAFEKQGVKIASSLGLSIQDQAGQLEEDEWGDDEGNPPDDDATEHEKKIGRADLFGGDIPVLPEGMKLESVQSNRPSSTFTGFLDTLVGQFVLGLGFPPAFFLDERLTGPNQRSVLKKAERRFAARTRTHSKFLQWTYRRVVAHGIATGEIKASPKFLSLGVQTPPKVTIDSGRESREEREDVKMSLMTRQKQARNQGGDWVANANQSLAETEYIITKAQKLAEKLDVEPEMILKTFGFEGKPPAPVAAPAAPVEGEKPPKEDDKNKGKDPKAPKKGEKKDDKKDE